MEKSTDINGGLLPPQVTTMDIHNAIYTLRNQQVMLDFDLARIYGYEVKRMNEQVKRNIARFPEDFMFQLTVDEVALVKSHFATSPDKTFYSGQMEYQKHNEKRFNQIFEYISEHEESSQKIFFDGQIFDAFHLMTELIRNAEKDIILIDGYVDVATLNILSKKKEGVNVLIYSLPTTRLTAQDIGNFNAQYQNLEVKYTTAFHDRFLIIDGILGYHIGASIKDAGKKCFGINKIEDAGVINDLMQRAELTA